MTEIFMEKLKQSFSGDQEFEHMRSWTPIAHLAFSSSEVHSKKKYGGGIFESVSASGEALIGSLMDLI